jgi:hypothetical protein
MSITEFFSKWAISFSGGGGTKQFAYKLTLTQTVALWIITPCSSQTARRSKRTGGKLGTPPATVVSCLAFSPNLKIETTSVSETLGSHRTTHHYNPENHTFHKYPHKNLKLTFLKLLVTIFADRSTRFRIHRCVLYIYIYFKRISLFGTNIWCNSFSLNFYPSLFSKYRGSNA